MSSDTPSKVQTRHLKRNAFLYVRQSSLRQVFENSESTKRQYDLRQRAISLGWRVDQVIVIDSDQGQSGKSSADREGFQRLVTEVSLGRAGIVMGLEVSRLARNSSDWHRLLEICALTDTLVLDDDGLYDPAHFNDRLLLGLKGTMSEAELHLLRARLRGGMINKARRGELEIRLPIGFVYDAEKNVRLDPDISIQESVRQLFRTFHRTGSALATVKAFQDQRLKFPRRIYRGPNKGDVLWSEFQHSRVLWILHHPRYTGAFCFGRTHTRRRPDGRQAFVKLAPEKWIALIRDAHEGYITWEQFEHNVQRLRDNAQALGAEREKGPPREGSALLQGLAVCAQCGERMTVRYHQRGLRMVPDYMCQARRIQGGGPLCQHIPGGALDDAIGKLLVDTVTPMTLEVALAVQKELESRCEETERLRQHDVERARYRSALAEAKDRYEKQRLSDRAGLSDQQRAAIMALAKDFPRLWNDPHTPQRERKRMARLLITDVTLLKTSNLRAQLRFKGGATHTLTLPLAKSAWMLRQTPDTVVREINRLLDDYTEREIANLLNSQGMISGEGKRFNRTMVAKIRSNYGLETRYSRLRARGMLTLGEIATRLDISVPTAKSWRHAGRLRSYRYNDKGETLCEQPGPETPIKYQYQRKNRIESTPSAVGRNPLNP